MKKIILLTFTAIAVIVISVGCKKSTTSTSPGTNEVFMQNTVFSPSSITVAVNTTIKWTNKDGMAHTVTSTSGLFDSGNISSGSTYSHQFTATGTYAYKCTIHSGMSGTVIVQ